MKMLSWPRRTLHSAERGQELVEFALVVPLLALIAFGVLDLGRAFHAAIVITNAAREGVRYVTRSPGDALGAITVTVNDAAGSGIDLADPARSQVTVTCPEGCGPGLPVRVTINYRFSLLWGYGMASNEIQMVRSAEMMVP